jgi:hypothetical protein
MQDPLSLLSPVARRRLAIVAVLSTAALTGVLGSVDVALRNPAAEHGIVSFELAGNLERATAILDSWDAGARVYAALSLGIDYLYLLGYSTLLALLCSWGARRRDGAWRAIGVWLVWGQWLAALCDAVENFGLIRLLLGSRWGGWAALAASAAAVKFALVIAGELYGLASVFVRPPAPAPRPPRG